MRVAFITLGLAAVSAAPGAIAGKLGEHPAPSRADARARSFGAMRRSAVSAAGAAALLLLVACGGGGDDPPSAAPAMETGATPSASAIRESAGRCAAGTDCAALTPHR